MKHSLSVLSMFVMVGLAACEEKKDETPDAAAKTSPAVTATASAAPTATVAPTTTATATTTASVAAEPSDAGKTDAGKPAKK